MAATISDFTNTATVSEKLNVQWPIMARALQGLGCLFSAKITTGTEPLDVLHGLMLGIDAQSTTAKDWRFKVNSSNAFVVDENTGTDVSPTWVTRLTVAAGAAFTADPSAHATSHKHGGSDEVATATAGANVIPKAGAGGTLADAFISSTSVVQHATTTPASGVIPKTNGSSVLPDGFISSSSVFQHFTRPTLQSFTSGSGTYTTPANVRWIKVWCQGGGGGGAGSGTTPGAAAAGGNSTFSTLTGTGGGAGSTAGGVGTGGTATGGDLNIAGGDGEANAAITQHMGGTGGRSFFGSGGPGGNNGPGAGTAGKLYGGGGGGAGCNATVNFGGGGGGGGCAIKIINSPASTYSYAVGAAGTAGSAGTSGAAGGAGAAGIVVVEEFYV